MAAAWASRRCPGPGTPTWPGSTGCRTRHGSYRAQSRRNVASGDTRSESLDRAVEYHIRTQRPDGTWDEPQATGTGFPRVFYLNYHMYRNTFPLLALATFRKARAQEN